MHTNILILYAAGATGATVPLAGFDVVGQQGPGVAWGDFAEVGRGEKVDRDSVSVAVNVISAVGIAGDHLEDLRHVDAVVSGEPWGAASPPSQEDGVR